MQIQKITFLEPFGATFSHNAYTILASHYDAPRAMDKEAGDNYVPASSNKDVLPLIARHGGYGTIAMETRAEGRVSEPLESFLRLLHDYDSNTDCPFGVVGAVELRLSFCLMARRGVTQQSIKMITAHSKAIEACRKRIDSYGLQCVEAPSNGTAAKWVAEDTNFKTMAALGPEAAAEHFGLEVLEREFEDRKAVTTFFLVAPKCHKTVTGQSNRILIVFRVLDMPNALVKTLVAFGEVNLNINQIHTVYTGDRAYDFAISIDVPQKSLYLLDRVLWKFEATVQRYLSFGPFEVFSR